MNFGGYWRWLCARPPGMEFQIGRPGAHFSGKADERMMSRPMTGRTPDDGASSGYVDPRLHHKDHIFELPDHRVQQERAGRHGLSRHRLKLLREAHHVL